MDSRKISVKDFCPIQVKKKSTVGYLIRLHNRNDWYTHSVKDVSVRHVCLLILRVLSGQVWNKNN